MADDELRPILCGLCLSFNVDEQTLQTAATNGFSLAKFETQCTCEETKTIVLCSKIVRLINIFLSGEEDCKIQYNENTAVIQSGTTTIYTKLVEGKYPNYNSVIPNNPYHIAFEKSFLMSAIKRVSAFSNSESYLIAYSLEGMNLTLKAHNIDLSCGGEENLMVTKEGADTVIGLKGNFTQNILSSFKQENLKMYYRDGGRAVVFRAETGNENYKQTIIQMPMMVN